MAKNDESIPMEPVEEPLTLEGGDAPVSSQTSSKIQAFGAAVARRATQQQFKRPLNLSGFGATRCRVFNSKVTLAAIDHMVNTINEWLDSNQIEIKYVSQVIGTMEGKVPEPNVIVMVWF